ncbi:hypothetical protein ALI22I_20080 [Saccharothrix sp. ALI-22-I]|uniref:hypothetical protein n=1 Tax=Saccharothrix sp. ALI-22-I TaxID=1933778 RepID=UPI00097C37C0|nr:hypothetical protein [Saccharothrix sp. ALI-22-I]ONI88044.1 hypothetical protein ALI22I_20080 [Saccharothrix sp. ALI-22-I]
MVHDLTTTPMIELVSAALTPGHPDTDAHRVEIQRRWNQASEQHALARKGFANPDQDEVAAIEAAYDPAAVEHARCYLRSLTLIHELWVLQEAGVRPDELYTLPDAPQRVVAVLRREVDRQDSLAQAVGGEPAQSTDTGQSTEAGRLALRDERDPLGAAAARLAVWTEQALFRESRVLLWEHGNLAGNMPQELLHQYEELCSQALARLDGPWALEEFLASPVGKDDYLFRDPATQTALHGLDIALGRPGHTVTEQQILQARREIHAEIRTRAADFADQPLPSDLDPATMTRPRLRGMHAEMRALVDFLGDALAVISFAGDKVARVDGRPVAPERQGATLSLHYKVAAAGDITAIPTTSVTVAGLRITYRHDHEAGEVVAAVDAAGSVKYIDPVQLPAALGMLLQPYPDAIASMARIEATVRRLGDGLVAGRASGLLSRSTSSLIVPPHGQGRSR